MRILSVGNLYPPHHLGGYELMWRSAVEHMRARGHDVRVLTTDHRVARPDPDLPEHDDVHRELRWYWREHEFPRLGMRERVALERHNARVLERHLADLHPDVVNWWAMGGMSLSLVARVPSRGRPAVGVVVDDWMLYGPKVDAWQRALARLGPLGPALGRLAGAPAIGDLGSAASWLFVSETCRRHAAGIWRLDQAEIVPGGVDPELFPRAPERQWGWRLLYLGRIDERKGIATAVRALQALPQATLRVVGEGDQQHRRELRELARELAVAERVEWGRAARGEVAATYADADAILFPVLWEEPWGLVPLEAMAVGRPVIATGRGGSGEYLRDGENCLVYAPADDPGALAAAVKRLVADQALRRGLREGGFATAARFTEERFNDGVAAAIEAAAGADRTFSAS
jgi:glycogen synthase